MINDRILYLNNNGSKWIILVNGKKPQITLKTKSGKTINRIPNYHFSFGNYSGVCINYKSKKIECFIDTLLDD